MACKTRDLGYQTVINLLRKKIKNNHKTYIFYKKKLIQNNKIAKSRIPDKTNVEI